MLLSFLIVEETEAQRFVVIGQSSVVYKVTGPRFDKVWLQSLCPEPSEPVGSVASLN